MNADQSALVAAVGAWPQDVPLAGVALDADGWAYGRPRFHLRARERQTLRAAGWALLRTGHWRAPFRGAGTEA